MALRPWAEPGGPRSTHAEAWLVLNLPRPWRVTFRPVLTAMRLPDERIRGAMRISWCHLTEAPDWEAVLVALRRLQGHVWENS